MNDMCSHMPAQPAPAAAAAAETNEINEPNTSDHSMPPFEKRLSEFVSNERVMQLQSSLGDFQLVNDRIDIAWASYPSPVGDLLLASHRGCLIRVAFENEGFDTVLQELADELGARTLRSPRQTDDTRRQLDEYFDGERTQFTVPHSLQLTHGRFRRQVQEKLHEVPFGETASYRDVAELTGSPKAVRAVGTACATNPLPIVVPCHRVVRSDGALGNYLGGPEAKEFLLSHETAHHESAVAASVS